jgi:hypothetical protein
MLKHKSNGPPKTSSSSKVGIKTLCHATGARQHTMRSWLRRRYGRHQSWELWLFTEEEAAQLIADYKEMRERTPWNHAGLREAR